MSNDSDVQVFTMPVSEDVFGGLGDLLKQFREFLLQNGCDNMEEYLAKLDVAIDALLAINVPQIPDTFEAMIDNFLGQLAKSQARVWAKKFCEKRVLPT